ncbi:MAG: hypothetical protein LBT04_00805 [Prevotellaceae bacterium]|jgi:hypothetical protein|nr:hypothetical protein [Prevotellaceae bacterium]
MKRTKVSFLTLLFAAVLLPTGINAQVTIGQDKTPETFSLLELISNGERGLRLPQLTTLQRKALSDAYGTEEAIKGLTIYNTIKKLC